MCVDFCFPAPPLISTNPAQNQYQQLLLPLLLALLALTPAFHARPLTTVREINRSIAARARTIYYRNHPPNTAGHYNYEFQTSNGITTKAAGNEHGAVGVVQYVTNEGLPVTFTYVADANGYQPSGDYAPKHLPRQLAYIRNHKPVDEKKSRRW